MTKFRVTILADDGDTHIYTDATTIEVANEKIEVEYEDKRATHQMGCTDEVVIKPID